MKCISITRFKRLLKKKGLSATEGSLRNRTVDLGKLDSSQLPFRNKLPVVPIISMAKAHLKANLEWLLGQNNKRRMT